MPSSFTGLGQDGYLRIQKEVTYGTDLVSSMTDIPTKEGTDLVGFTANIENANQISSRLLQDPDLGRQIRTGTIVLDTWPTLIGLFFNLFLGTSSDAAVGDGAFTHTWLSPVAGERIGKSFTAQQAKGIDLANQMAGGVINELVFDQDSEGNLQVTANCVFQSLTEDVARVVSFTFPDSSTDPSFNFGNVAFTITPSGGSALTTCANSFTLTLSLNYDLERFKMCETASDEIREPVFTSIPTAVLSMNVDAEDDFVKKARNHTEYSVDIDITSTISEPGTTPTFANLAFEFPGCRLNPETTIPSDNDRTNMDLEFNCGHGGTTTGSGGNEVMWETRVVDATAAYA